MIGSVRGILRDNREMQVEIETASGLGYELSVPDSVAAQLPAKGQEVFLLTHLVMRDNTMELYGFADAEQKALFQKLIGISGVGPRSALALLSVLRPPELFAAVMASDEKVLTRAQGIGGRTARRIIGELRDTLAQPLGGTADVQLSPRAEACAALESLSFTAKEAAELVRRAGAEVDADDTDALVRTALRLAGSRKTR